MPFRASSAVISRKTDFSSGNGNKVQQSFRFIHFLIEFAVDQINYRMFTIALDDDITYNYHLSDKPELAPLK